MIAQIVSRIVLIFFILTGFQSTSFAQGFGHPPPVRTYYDHNNVDLLTGRETYTDNIISIGSGPGKLSANVSSIGAPTSVPIYSDVHSYWGAVNEVSTTPQTLNVSIGASSQDFIVNGNGTFSPKENNGNTLVFANGHYVYTLADGTIAKYNSAITGIYPLQASHGVLDEIISPRNEIISITHEKPTTYDGVFLRSVTNNYGYQLRFDHDWGKKYEIAAINNRIEYCDPNATSCSIGNNWGVAEITARTSGAFNTSQGSIVEANGDTTILNPSSVIIPPNIEIQYEWYPDFPYRIHKVMTSGGTWNYSYSESGDTLTTSVTAPTGGTRVVTSSISKQLVISDKDENNRTVSYIYDSDNRVKKITYPNGTSTEYVYDSRGNVTETKQNPIASSSLPSIITTAHYPTSCANPKTCNKPIWTRDARGKQTDYTYDPTHGGITKILGPAPTSGAARPEIRYYYVQRKAKVKNAAGNLVDAEPIWMLRWMRSCPNGGSSCYGSNDELRVYQDYRTSYNLSLSYVNTRNGTNTIASRTDYMIDNYGNQTWVDGPLSGTVDRIHYFYEADLQRLIGFVGPDPDGSGPLKNRAQKLTYTDGLLQFTEQGTTSGTSLAAWNAFTSIQKIQYSYDNYGRQVATTHLTGSNIHGVQQTSYDTRNRVVCATLRMNPATFNSLPSDACTPAADGPFGPDRISKMEYNHSGQITKRTAGFGTDDASIEQVTYYANGNTNYLIDGEGNKTRNYFDHFGRHYLTRFPHPTTDGAINTADQIRKYFDNYGRQYRTTQRDGSNIYTTYDDLGRPTFINAPNNADDITMTYDHFGRMKTMSRNGQTLTNVYDALGRKKSETGVLGTVSYDYDAAGRANKITYPTANGSSLFINYDYDNVGAVKAVRENGATSGIGVLASYAYNDLGQRTQIVRGNGLITNYNYDAASRLQSLAQNAAGSSNDIDLTFTYNPAGQIATKSRSNAAYAWDGAGVSTETFNVNNLNQAISSLLGTITYDGRGNVKTVGAGTTGKSYSYDAYNNLTQVMVNLYGGPKTTLDYDPAGRLYKVKNLSTGVGARFAYSGNQMIAEYNPDNTTLVRRYVYGPGIDQPILEYSASGTRTWYMQNHQGSVIGHTNDSGTVIRKLTYDEYGVPSTANAGRFQYTGQVWLHEVNMYYYKARMYDPYMKRFLQTDPIGYGDGMNMYAYVGGDPVNATDPMGLSRIKRRRPTNCRPTKDGVLCDTTTVSSPSYSFISSGSGIDLNVYMPGPLNLNFPIGGGIPLTPETLDGCPSSVNPQIETSVNGNEITVTATITWSGAGANNSSINAYSNAISSAWTVSFPSVSINTNFISAASGGVPFEISDQQVDDITATRPLVLSGLNGITDTQRNNNLWIGAHEFGHYLSLADRYGPGGFPPFFGYFGSMMGHHGGTVQEFEAQALLRKVIACQKKS